MDIDMNPQDDKSQYSQQKEASHKQVIIAENESGEKKNQKKDLQIAQSELLVKENSLKKIKDEATNQNTGRSKADLEHQKGSLSKAKVLENYQIKIERLQKKISAAEGSKKKEQLLLPLLNKNKNNKMIIDEGKVIDDILNQPLIISRQIPL